MPRVQVSFPTAMALQRQWSPTKSQTNAKMWQELYELWPSLSFTQSFMMQVFDLLAHEKQWQLSEFEITDFVQTCASRFRLQARHLKQAQLKGIKWIHELELGKATPGGPAVITAVGVDIAAPSAPASASSSPAAPTTPAPTTPTGNMNYKVGFDPETVQAWRQCSAPNSIKEFASGHRCSENLSDDIIATWPDGMEAEIPNVPGHLYCDLRDETRDSSQLGTYSAMTKEAMK